jgi:hypothetical protein
VGCADRLSIAVPPELVEEIAQCAAEIVLARSSVKAKPATVRLNDQRSPCVSASMGRTGRSRVRAPPPWLHAG